MKTTRKFMAILMVLAMILSMGAFSAFAASITITPPTVPDGAEEVGITYTAYKIFDATINGDNVSYTIEKDSPYYQTVSDSVYFDLTLAAGSTTTYVVTAKDTYTNDVANTFAEDLKAVETAAAGTLTKQNDGTYKLEGLNDGYYLVTSSVGTDLILHTIGDVNVTPKNDYPTQDKKVEGKDTYTTANMGDTLNFTINVTIPEDAVGDIVVHDTMTGLEYEAMTAVDGITDTTTTGDGCSVHFTLSADYVAAHKNTKITIAYTAILTADVANNESYLVDDTYTSAPDDVFVYSTDVVINKVAAGTKTPLEGAKFVLKNVDGDFYKVTDGNVTWVDDQANATEVTTDPEGVAKFENIADGTYYLVETEAPAGYNLLTEAKGVTVTAVTETDTEGNTIVIDIPVEVENNSGTELPSTGGMGTVLLIGAGSVLAVAAALFLVTKKRVKNAEV